MPRYGATAKRGKCAFARRGEAEWRRRGVARRGVVLCEAEAAASEPAGLSTCIVREGFVPVYKGTGTVLAMSFYGNPISAPRCECWWGGERREVTGARARGGGGRVQVHVRRGGEQGGAV